MLTRLTAGALFAGLALAPAAGAVTAVSPIDNAAAAIHPLLMWSLAPGETTDDVVIANNPATTPSGEFLDEHRVTGDVFFDGTVRWSPTSPLMAGTYWWIVSADDASFNTIRTHPAQFHIDPVLTHGHFTISKFRFLRQLDVDVFWTTNAPSVLTTVRVSRNGKTIWKRSRRTKTFAPMLEDQTSFSWTNRHKVRKGRKVRVTVTVNLGGGRSTHASRVVKAP
jgi:hypothetical protein